MTGGAAIGWFSAYLGVVLENRLKWKQYIWPALFMGLLLFISAIVLMFNYDTGYDQVVGVQIAIGGICLTLGLIEWIPLFKAWISGLKKS